MWAQTYPHWSNPGLTTHYFAAPLTADDVASIVFGEEGQHWRLMAIGEFLDHPLGIPHQQQSVRDYLRARGQ